MKWKYKMKITPTQRKSHELGGTERRWEPNDTAFHGELMTRRYNQSRPVNEDSRGQRLPPPSSSNSSNFTRAHIRPSCLSISILPSLFLFYFLSLSIHRGFALFLSFQLVNASCNSLPRVASSCLYISRSIFVLLLPALFFDAAIVI